VNTSQLYFTAPREIEIRSANLEPPGAGQLLVANRLSAISAGTEMLIYRGLAPREMETDTTLPALRGLLRYPLSYGYASVGQVLEVGPGVDPRWRGRRVFAYQPHASHFVTQVDEVLALADDLADEDAVFIPSLETAVSLVQDGRPILGEAVVVFGQGVVGLLVTSLLSRIPLGALVTLERFPLRRQASVALGPTACLDPALADLPTQLAELLPTGRSDLTFELSGDPAALNQAISLTGFTGRVVLGSWYGTQPSPLDLGGEFHRSRIHIVSSQVSSIAPELSGRWTKPRRLEVVRHLLPQIAPHRWITHTVTLAEAPRAYQLLDEQPATALQIVLRYAGGGT
jgi:2-desacetyl-2-hydroxyethyl bacteriochlorophyllide A dehydrogenase